MPKQTRSKYRHRKTGKSRKSRTSRITTKKQRGGGLADVLPITTWQIWNQIPGATLFGPSQPAPPPLANGGLYSAPQSTGGWAAHPFPPTQYAMAVEAAKTSGIPEVFYHQRPTTDVGNSWSPYVAQSISSDHWSARLPSSVSRV